MRENTVMRTVWLAVGAITGMFRSTVRVVLFRVNTGQAWVSAGKPVRNKDGSITLPPGSRPIAMGFAKPDGKTVVGTSDLCGLTSVVVTQQMVGSKVALFTAIETKESGGGDGGSDDQWHFINFVRDAGGIAGVANTPAVAQAIVTDYCRKRSIS